MKYVEKFRISLLALSAAFIMMVPVLAAGPVSAQVPDEAKQAACAGIQTEENPQDCDDAAGTSLAGLAGTVINILSWIIGVAAVIVMIIGGLKFITANGDANSIASARRTIIYALIGVVIAVSAQVLVRFVVTGVDI